MNDLRAELLGKPSMIRRHCVVCGLPATNKHHVIPKGMGGTRLEPRIPKLSLCGMGNASGCHGMAHSGRLHFKWDGTRWMFRTTDGCSYQEALELDGWLPCIEEMWP